MTYTVVLLICLSGVSARDCQVGNAVDVMYPPEEQTGLSQCMVYGLQFAAESELVIPGKTWPKIYCRPPSSIVNGNVG